MQLLLLGVLLLVPALLVAGIRQRLLEPERALCIIFENGEEMAEGILRQARRWAASRGKELRLLVTAGSSSDGTAALLRYLAFRESWIEVVEVDQHLPADFPTLILRMGHRPAQALRALSGWLEQVNAVEPR